MVYFVFAEVVWAWMYLENHLIEKITVSVSYQVNSSSDMDPADHSVWLYQSQVKEEASDSLGQQPRDILSH